MGLVLVVLNALALGLVTTGVVLSLWLFAAADAWYYLLIGLLVQAGLLFWLVSRVLDRKTELRVPDVSVLLLLLLTLIALQVVALPRWVCEHASPLVTGLRTEAEATLESSSVKEALEANCAGLAGEEQGGRLSCEAPDLVFMLSACRDETLRSLFLFLTYVGVFVVMANACRRWRHVRAVAVVLVGSAFVMAVVAIVHRFSGDGRMLWIQSPRFGGNVLGAFSNRNHFAAYMNLGFGLAMGLLLSMVGRRWQEGVRGAGERLQHKVTGAVVLCAFVLMIMGGAVGLSMSRAGMISLVIGIVVSLWVSARVRGFGVVPRVALAVTVVLVVGGLVWLGWRPVIDRLATLGDVLEDMPGDFRVRTSLDTLTLFGANLWGGSGLGSFEHIFPFVQTCVSVMTWRFKHAHNDWVQGLAEGGVLVGGVFLACLVLWGRFLFKARAGSLGRARLFVVGNLCGCGAIVFHSFFDYSLHRPATACLLSAVAGLCVSAMSVRSGPHLEERLVPCMLGLRWKVGYGAMLGVVLSVMAYGVGEFSGEAAFARFLYTERGVQRGGDAVESDRLAQQAHREALAVVEYGGIGPDSLVELSEKSLRLAYNDVLSRKTRIGMSHLAVHAAGLAVVSSPTDFLSWLWLARGMMAIGWWDAADECLEQSKRLANPSSDVRLYPRVVREGMQGNRGG